MTTAVWHLENFLNSNRACVLPVFMEFYIRPFVDLVAPSLSAHHPRHGGHVLGTPRGSAVFFAG